MAFGLSHNIFVVLSGTHKEVQDALVSFGIPRDALPVTQDGTMSTDQHLVWLERREQIEAKRAAQAYDEEKPSSAGEEEARKLGFGILPTDILFGRGKTIIDHPGNVRFRQFIDYYMRKYEESTISEKTCLTEIVVRTLQGNGVRFLKKDSKYSDWVEVDHDTARNKVSHAFRNRRNLFNPS